MKFEITLEQAEKIGAYLMARPFVEVETLIQILRMLKPIEEKKND
jgi:hypothetical protein